MIDISGLDKAEVLAALYNSAGQQGMGLRNARGRDQMTVEQAREYGPAGYHDYVFGRVMKVDLTGDTLDPWGFDRDNGNGAAAHALASLIAARDSVAA